MTGTNLRTLPTSELRPNAYNPNAMSADEFKELVAEVRHLGRLPKPVVVRQRDDGFEIVDGEHGWRAAQECDLAEITCEVIEADDFEAMRQTYKRNQHGTHDKVLEGRMFRSMLELRGMSQRELAREMELSEGTIRNAMLYAEADRLRNGYAFGELTIRQIREYLSLPAPIRDYWLDAGADPQIIDKAGTGIPYWEASGKLTKINCDDSWWSSVAERGFAVAMNPGEGYHLTEHGFVENGRNALTLMLWADHYKSHIQHAEDFALVAAQIRAPASVLGLLPIGKGPRPLRALLTPEQWRDILQRVSDREPSDDDIWNTLVRACIELHFRQTGIDHDYTDPRIEAALEYLKSAPDFIRESSISLADKLELADATDDSPDVTDDLILEAKREAVQILNSRDGWLSATPGHLERIGLTGDSKISDENLKRTQAQAATWTAASAFKESLDKLRWDRQIARRNALVTDAAALLEHAVEVAKQNHEIRTGTLQGRPAHELLRDRLAMLPDPERRLLCALLIGEEYALPVVWINAMKADDDADRAAA